MRVLHFVTGGFSGATQVAVDLCLAAQRSQDMQVLLVLRRKRNTDAGRVQALRDKGLDVRVVPGWSHLATVLSLRQIALEWKPDILVAHGFSDHLWGRYAGILAKVPHLVHVEHNARERYTRWRLAQARWLAKRTAAMVGVSEGVRQVLVNLGFPPERCVAIPNGIDMQRFPASRLVPWCEREASIVMAARFARQKDHATLIRALPHLAEHGLRPKLYLAGGGKSSTRRQMQLLVQELDLQEQVHFLGHVADLPALLMQSCICVLASHYEGYGLSMAEGMAAGCACIGSDVVGLREVVQHGQTGYLVPESDVSAMASALLTLLTQPQQATSLAQAARTHAERSFDTNITASRYGTLFSAIHTRRFPPIP